MTQARRFQITERVVGKGWREIRIEGELDLATVGELRELLDRAVAECDGVAISLEGCEFIDSTGIAVIVQAHRRLADAGGRLAAYGAAAQVLRTLEITGLTSNGMVVETLDEFVSDGQPQVSGSHDGG